MTGRGVLRLSADLPADPLAEIEAARRTLPAAR